MPDHDEPVLTGMTCVAEPPTAPRVDVRPLETARQHLAAVEVDWAVWNISGAERERRLVIEAERFEAGRAAGTVHLWAAYENDARSASGVPSTWRKESL